MSTNEKVTDTAIDNVEVVIDTFAKHFLTGDIQKIAVDLPVIKNVAAVIALVHNIRNYSIAKKIGGFVKTLKESSPDKELYHKLVEKYGNEKILEEVLIQVDRFNKEEQAEIYGYIFSALLKNELDWEEFCTFGYFIERCNPLWLIIPIENIKDTGNLERDSMSSRQLTSLSIMMGAPWDGGESVLAWKFWKFGLKPYQENKLMIEFADKANSAE